MICGGMIKLLQIRAVLVSELMFIKGGPLRTASRAAVVSAAPRRAPEGARLYYVDV